MWQIRRALQKKQEMCRERSQQPVKEEDQPREYETESKVPSKKQQATQIYLDDASVLLHIDNKYKE